MAEVPAGWKVNPNFGTVVYQPGNIDDYYEPPLIEFQARCEGECKAEVISVALVASILSIADNPVRRITPSILL